MITARAGSRRRTGTVELHARFQGCNDPLGVCYPPIEKLLTVALPAGGGDTAGAACPAAAAARRAGCRRAAARRRRAADQRAVRGGSRLALIAAFFGFGLLLAFTPCMLPMIPILSGIIAGQAPR